MTSAPSTDSMRVAHGPARHQVKSKTRTPSSGLDTISHLFDGSIEFRSRLIEAMLWVHVLVQVALRRAMDAGLQLGVVNRDRRRTADLEVLDAHPDVGHDLLRLVRLGPPCLVLQLPGRL